MLGRLFKYEMKASSKTILISYGGLAALVLAAAVFGLGLRLPMYSAMLGGAVIMAAMAVMILTYGVLATRFYKGMFASEGYFWNTLPVSGGKLYTSRLLTALVWMTASMAVAVAGFIFGYWLMVFKSFSFMGADFTELMSAMNVIFTPGSIALFCVLGIIQQMVLVIAIYFSITVSNARPLQNMGKGGAVLAFIVYYFVAQVLNGLASFFIPLTIRIDPYTGIHFTNESMSVAMRAIMGNPHRPMMTSPPVGYAAVFVEIILGVAMLIVTLWLLRRKTSLK